MNNWVKTIGSQKQKNGGFFFQEPGATVFLIDQVPKTRDDKEEEEEGVDDHDHENEVDQKTEGKKRVLEILLHGGTEIQVDADKNLDNWIRIPWNKIVFSSC